MRKPAKVPGSGKASDAVKVLSQNCSLLAVNLIECAAKVMSVQANDQIHDLDIEMQFGIGRPVEQQQFIASVAVAVACRAKADPSRVIAKVSCTFALRYLATDAPLFATLKDEDLGEFAVHVGSLHGWPYLRQFCQDMAQRMMIPPFMLPPLSAKLFAAAPVPSGQS